MLGIVGGRGRGRRGRLVDRRRHGRRRGLHLELLIVGRIHGQIEHFRATATTLMLVSILELLLLMLQQTFRCYRRGRVLLVVLMVMLLLLLMVVVMMVSRMVVGVRVGRCRRQVW